MRRAFATLCAALACACTPAPADVTGKLCSLERSCGSADFRCVDGRCVAGPAVGGTMLVPRGSTWRYFETATTPGDGWTLAAFDDTAWKSGPAPLGYGEDGEVTVVGYGPDPNNRYLTSYYRLAVDVPAPSALTGLTVLLRRDDGAAVYLNGTEVFRSNLPLGPLAPTTLAADGQSGASETTYFEGAVDAGLLVEGKNQLAVEVHQHSVDSNDLSFDLELVGTP